MKYLIIIVILFSLFSCDNAHDVARLLRFGMRANRVISNNDSIPHISSRKTNITWGMSQIVRIDTLKNQEAEYSINLKLPVDTTQSEYMTISVLPHMINGYSEIQSSIELSFYQDTSFVSRYLVSYSKTSNKQYDYRIIKKYDSPTMHHK